MNRKKILGFVVLSFMCAGAARALSSSEVLLLEKLRSYRSTSTHQLAPTIMMPVVTESKDFLGDDDLSEILERLAKEECERRLLDTVLSQIVDELEKEKER